MAVIVGLRTAQAIAPARTKLPTLSRQVDAGMPRHRWSASDGIDNVVRFRPRGAVPRWESEPGPRDDTMNGSPVKGLQAYESPLEGDEDDEDYQHRMRVNLVAAVFVMMLIVGASWVMDSLVQSTREGQTWQPLHSNQATR
jgi:hypothetical protein